MAVTAVKVGKIVSTALAMLMRELVVARTVWTDAVNGTDFTGALNDTVTVRMRGRSAANTRVLRAGTPVAPSSIVEFPVPVTLTTDVYQSVPVTDEEMELDIVDFAAQVLTPQIEAVAIGIEDEIAAEITGATYEATQQLVLNEVDPYLTAVAARKRLNDANVPKGNRFWLVGSGVEAALLSSDRFVKADNIGAERAENAFSEAIVGRVAGFTVLQANAIDEDASYAYHKTAFIAATRAPRKPDGAAFGQGVSLNGIAMRWIKDYDYLATTDRSLVNTWIGTASVLDPDPATPTVEGDRFLQRAIEITIES